ncbi:MAG TPA: CDP-diacylglycerol O-phosphatidyltransferase [Candidatus Binatia bacterium]|nr:CDP-diacylglycerol O-phosphatidyltransferase [Candidatus Binatia bacterium]
MNQPSAPSVLAEAGVTTATQFSLRRKIAAWAVHAYTASGTVIGFLALRATVLGRPREAFLWMLVAVLVDATDGTLARAVEIKRVLPWFDGAKLDDIVDYFTFVIVPVVFLYQMRLLPVSGTLLFVALPLLASAYGFCQAAAKTPDFFFTGFPSYWNIVAFYLYAGRTPLWLNGVLICVLSLFVFIPIRYIYPTRTIPFRRLTNLLGGLWVGVLVFLLWQFPAPSPWLVLFSLYYPFYYTFLSFYLHATAGKVLVAP